MYGHLVSIFVNFLSTPSGPPVILLCLITIHQMFVPDFVGASTVNPEPAVQGGMVVLPGARRSGDHAGTVAARRVQHRSRQHAS